MLKLVQRGISRGLAEAVLDEQSNEAANREDSELTAALIYARKNLLDPIHVLILVLKITGGIWRLARNGFTFDVAKQVMALPSADAADELLDEIYPHQLG